MGSPKRILMLTIGSAGAELAEPDFIKMLRAKGCDVQVRKVIEANSLSHIFQAFWLSHDVANFDLVIAHEYFSSFGLCLRSVISGGHAKLASIGFNISRRYLLTPIGFINKLINWIFGQLSLVVVHSQSERKLFRRMHQLDSNKIAVALWGYDLPQTYSQTSPDENQRKPYVCMVGRNNRDFATLENAIRSTPIEAVFVTSRSNQVSVESSGQVQVLYDMPMEKCLGIINSAVINVILLKDDQRGAGHITAVSAMLLGKAQVFSLTGVLTDYLVPGRHGLAVSIGNEHEVREAILRLWEDRRLAEQFGAEAQKYAQEFLSNLSFQRRLFRLLDQLLEGLPAEIVDRAWRQYSDAIGRTPESHEM